MPQKAGSTRHATGAGHASSGTQPAKTIVWLASYPKSGNTWTRIFLANYLVDPDTPVPINQVRRFAASDADGELYRRVAPPGVDLADPGAQLRLRPRVLRGIAANGADLNFVKSHCVDAAVAGTPLIPRDCTRAAICMVRHPLDVAVSYARHFGMTPAQACRSISRPGNSTAAAAGTVKQFIGSWAENVRSWTGARDFPVHLMRYEDMREDPHAAFRAMLEFLGITPDPARLDRAVRFASFDELQRQERAGGFVEASRNAGRFFHSGTSGQWAGILSDEDIAVVRAAARAEMDALGYA